MRLICKLLSGILLFSLACSKPEKSMLISAEQILGNKEYTAISFGGFRQKTRKHCPSVKELKEDMKILSALGIKFIRTYNTQLYPHAERTLQAIKELKEQDEGFEMHVMLGIWIECKGAWTEVRTHNKENLKNNEAEFNKALELSKKYVDIVKVIAVGNESMVHWAESYFVTPDIVLEYVSKLQELKNKGELNKELWITSSDNFASWGGGSVDYHNEDLIKLIKTVDYVSMHTYPFHDTHYNPEFWQSDSSELNQEAILLMKTAMERAGDYAISQYESTKKYIQSIVPDKPIHIGETGWATSAYQYYGDNGSQAAGEFQQKLYYDYMRKWSQKNKLSCFFFEAFDEPWKDSTNEKGSENHFGLINIKGEAKFALWADVEAGTFEGLKRGGRAITKTFNGNRELLLSKVKAPTVKSTH